MNRRFLFLRLMAAVFSFFFILTSFGQGTAFQYQGRLNNSGSPANGNYDFQFTVYNASNGVPVSGTVTNFNVPVSNGLFSVTLDFGQGIFTGPSLWLDIGVETNGAKGTNFTMLTPLQPILPVPYAIFANSASNLVGVLAAAQLSGTLPASAFTGYTNTVALTNGANLFSGSFSGNGAGVTNVNVTNLTGVLADAQLPNNTAYVNSNQTFTASNTFTGGNTFTGVNLFTNLGNSFSGSFFGNGLVGWIVVPGTTVSAQIDHGYLLTNAQTVTVTLPASASTGDIIRIAGAGATGWQVAQNAGQSVLGNFVTYGKNWTKNPTYENWTCIASSADGTKMAATAYGTGIFLSQNSGATWSQSSALPAQWVSVASSSDGTILAAAVTNGGSIYISTNSGSTWAALASSAGNWSCVAAASGGNQFVGTDSGVGIYTFSTTAFLQGFVSANNWACVASSANGSNLVAAIPGGSIYISTSAGASGSWNAAGGTSGPSWKALASSASGNILAAAADVGGIYMSYNYGANWSQTTAPTTNWVSLAASSDGSKLIAVASGGAIYTSANWGATWTPQTNNLPASADWDCCASSSSGGTLAAGVYSTIGGGIYTSQAASQTTTTLGTAGYISGGQGSAVELQYIGNNEFMPVSFSGTIWGN